MKRASVPTPTGATPSRRQVARMLPLLLAAAALLSACGKSSPAASSGSSKDSTVNIVLTPAGCAPRPESIAAGQVDVNVVNKDANAVSEAELRTSDLSHILGEQENLTPGLSGGFSLNLQPGHYVINCPGASQRHWSFVVKGKSSGPRWNTNRALVQAVASYRSYVDQTVAQLVTSSQQLCSAINSGNLTAAQRAYPKARVYYERIEPVAEIWGALDTNIDGRWDNPVTVPAQFIGFHKIEQLMWENNTLSGTARLCTGLVQHEQQLLTLVRAATYNPIEMASGAADLINEAGNAKVTGEEERYSNTDLVVLKANIDGAQEIVNLLRPYLQSKDPKLISAIDQHDTRANRIVNEHRASPGYDDTGYVEYSTVLDPGRRQLSNALAAYEKSLAKLSLTVSS